METDFEHAAFFFRRSKVFTLADGNGREPFVTDGGSFAEGDDSTETKSILVLETLAAAIFIEDTTVFGLPWIFWRNN